MNRLAFALAFLIFIFCTVAIAVSGLILLALIGKLTGLGDGIYFLVTSFVFAYYAQRLFSWAVDKLTKTDKHATLL